MTKKFSVPRGTSDILPEDISLWQEIEAISRNLLDIYNYKEIRTPIFEEIGLFKRSLGQTSDIVNKQLLQLASEKEEGFVLRPEGTASVVRSYIENGLDRKDNLSKLFYFGQMFRGERPQKGRLRQFNQVGVEAIGPNTCSPYLDAEVISLSVTLLEAFGVKDYELKINTLGTLEDKENFSKMLKNGLKDKISNLCDDCRDRFNRNVFRILDCKSSRCQEVVADLKEDNSYLSEESLQYYNKVKEALDILGVKYKECSNLVRGLDYYTHVVFEISSSSLGSQNALGAGGRYNSLVSQLGGSAVDAVGFALGIERILLAIEGKKVSNIKLLDCYVIALDESLFQKAFEILKTLRESGISADISYKATSLKNQMRYANKSCARKTIILGQDELEKGLITLKDMETGEQLQCSFEEIVNKIKE
ncbi:MAG: histidine--tRNA ligase [Candidatus Zapsychrus exili]|nr:histidine--tRNA ligase [Candidatus Zapsychrus exili]